MYIYTVNPGDTLYSIAQKFGIPPARLAEDNGITNLENLVVGQDILIPNGRFYEVKRGDSLYSVALLEGTNISELLRINPNITEPFVIYPGQIIRLPEQNTPKRDIEVNGYAYPNISRSVLDASLPYLTYLSIFSYSVNADGTLNNINDDDLVTRAKNGGVAPVMVITNTVAGGGFDSDLVSSILNSSTAIDTLLNACITIMNQKGYYALDVDFEYIPPADREAYNSFLDRAGDILRENGFKLFTAIAPKLSATQVGTLYEAHDYAAHGRFADRITIMTYEWGYLYGPPLAIAPYSEVRKVISYAVTEIPPRKILMGMPNYAYDWTLPYVEGRPARYLSVNEARDLAFTVGARIQYSEGAQAPFFEYTDSTGAEHIVWFDNARSTNARLNLVEEFGLAGVSFWPIMRLNIVNFKLIDARFNIVKVI